MTPRVKTLLAGMALGLSFSTTPLDAKEWSGTIGLMLTLSPSAMPVSIVFTRGVMPIRPQVFRS